MKTSASGKCLERLDMLVIHFASQRHPRSFSRTPVDLSIAWLETVGGFQRLWNFCSLLKLL